MKAILSHTCKKRCSNSRGVAAYRIRAVAGITAEFGGRCDVVAHRGSGARQAIQPHVPRRPAKQSVRWHVRANRRRLRDRSSMRKPYVAKAVCAPPSPANGHRGPKPLVHYAGLRRCHRRQRSSPAGQEPNPDRVLGSGILDNRDVVGHANPQSRFHFACLYMARTRPGPKSFSGWGKMTVSAD